MLMLFLSEQRRSQSLVRPLSVQRVLVLLSPAALWVLVLPCPSVMPVSSNAPAWRPCSPDLFVLLWLLSFCSLRVVGDAVLSGGVGVVLVAVGGVIYVMRCSRRWTSS